MANRILLADDSITIQKVVNLTFADEGIEVVAVSNGDQAERRLPDVQPDLVLADIFMPGKNGYELCETIKSSPQYHHVPVVLLVGAFEPFDQAEAHRVKADAHLTKPFESRTLVDTVRKLISASSRPRTGPLPPLPVPDAKAAPVESVSAPPPAVAPLEPRTTPPMTQPFNLDVPATPGLSIPSAPAVPVAALPLGYAYETGEEPLAMSIEVQVAEAPDEPARAAGGNLLRHTDDLSFNEAEPPFESFGLEDLFAAPPAPESTSGLAPGQPSPAAFAGPESSAGVPSTFGYAAEEMLLDFDQPAPAVTRTSPEPFAFDIDVREPASVDAGDMQPEGMSQEEAADRHGLKTTMLEAPPPTLPVEGAINTNPLEMPAPPATDEAGGPAYAVEATIDESALFNVDDPLGDVLDEGAAVTSAPAATGAPVEAPRFETGESDAPTQAQAEASPHSPRDYEVEFPAEPTVMAAAPAPVVEPPAFEPNPPAEPAAAAEMGFGFSPVIEEDEAAESLPHADTGEARFTTSSMWTNEEAHFAAIDIEATPVEEPAETPSQEPAAAAESFRFADDPSAYTTQSERPAEVAPPVVAPPVAAVPVADEAAVAPPAPAASADAPTGELSPSLIDEIVRRVVAQISDSVVREIAWEVVPDCVERVIKEVTAQEVAKR